MRALQTAHEAAVNSAHAPVVGADVLPTRHPARLNGEGRRADAYSDPALKLRRTDAAETQTPPPVRPRPPWRGRRAGDRRPASFPHPSLLTPQTPFMAQLMSQGQAPGVVAAKDAARNVVLDAAPAGEKAPSAGQGGGVAVHSAADLAGAQRRQFQQVDAYRKTVTMATDFIVRRYHLAIDFHGLLITDDRAVEMVV